MTEDAAPGTENVESQTVVESEVDSDTGETEAKTTIAGPSVSEPVSKTTVESEGSEG
ncbi:MAG: hypothetical protein M3164_02225 [Actinomycetota bacterium]|nr:hypothetical protein [Actinomycetota bacterium]